MQGTALIHKTQGWEGGTAGSWRGLGILIMEAHSGGSLEGRVKVGEMAGSSWEATS